MGFPVGSALELKQLVTPANPAATASLLYPKSDGVWYTKSPAGVETKVGNANVQTPAPTSPSLGQLWLDTADTAAPSVPAGAWTAYTPTWTAVTTNPVLNNGTLTGAYVLIGKTCHFRLKLVGGSTTAWGSGDWRLGLPVPSTSALITEDRLNIVAMVIDTGTAYWPMDFVTKQAASAVTIGYRINFTGGFTAIGATLPMTWGNTDTLNLSGTYEAA